MSRVFRVAPRVPNVATFYEPTAEQMAIAEAVRDACLPFVSMNRMSDVEHMDLRYIVIKVTNRMKIIAPQLGRDTE